MTAGGHRVSFPADGSVLELNSADDCTQCDCTKNK